MLWQYYVLRRGHEVEGMWDQLFAGRPVTLVYVAGRGFDTRALKVMTAFVENARASRYQIRQADLLLVDLAGYQLTGELEEQTENNARALEATFSSIGNSTRLPGPSSGAGDDDIGSGNSLRLRAESLLRHVSDRTTDIILDASSLPRATYLALLTRILRELVPDKRASNALFAKGVNFQVLVGEDTSLDAQIRSEDLSSDPVLIPGFSSALHAESFQDWPLVWFPILGENKTNELWRIMSSAIPHDAEICPVLPQPSRDLRRADRLLMEYKQVLFDRRETPTANIIHAHESHPFEAYRGLLGAMTRYRDSMCLVGGCRLVVTPLASKLITIGAGLACFEMRPASIDSNYGVAIPCAEPRRYLVSKDLLLGSAPQISAMVLTGEAYDETKA